MNKRKTVWSKIRKLDAEKRVHTLVEQSGIQSHEEKKEVITNPYKTDALL